MRPLTIRADCSPIIGTGHVMRMIALGQAWRDQGGEVRFIGSVSLLKERLMNEGFQIIDFNGDVASEADAQCALESTDPGDWIALDGYGFEIAYQKRLRSKGRRLLVVDDVCDRNEYQADLLLNQNLDADEYAYPVNEDVRLLLGTQYALIRNEFFAPIKDVPFDSGSINLLVTLGGADPLNLTATVINALQSIETGALNVKIVVGAANPNLAEIKKTAAVSTVPMKTLVDAQDMPSLMRWADLCVTAAGSTCWELCLFGVPMILFATAKNQEGVGRSLHETGAALPLPANASPEEIGHAILSLLADEDKRRIMASKGSGLVDGRGAARTAGEILCWGMTLRPANENDCMTILKWRNDPAVRAHSFNAAPIDEKTHRNWFAAKLVNPECLFYIAVDRDNAPLGQIRFDFNGPEAVISLSVAPAYFGRNVGTAMTRLACKKLRKTRPDAHAAALVKPDNPASINMFLKSGFTQTKSTQPDSLRFVWPGSDDD